MTGGKFSDGAWSWNEAHSLDAFGLTLQRVCFLMVAAGRMKLTVLMLLAS